MDESTAAAESAPQAPTSPHRELVWSWVVDWFHNAQLPTPLQNRISEAAEDLVRRLDAAKE